MANYNEEIYNLPFNMNTFNKLWGVTTPKQAKLKIKEQFGVMAQMAKKVIYLGAIDEYFDYCLGELKYRSLHFETELIHTAIFKAVQL